MIRPDPAAILQRNLAALGEHRPEVAALLREHRPRDAGYRLREAPDGRLVVTHPDAFRTPGGPSAENALWDAFSSTSAAAVAGVGDGRVLGLAASRPRGLHGSAVAVYLCEPDLDRLTAALSAADLTGPEGPIEHLAVRWFVGAGWEKAYHGEVAADPLLPLPDIHARLGVGEEAERAWEAVVAARRGEDAAAAEAARAWAASDEIERLSALGGEACRTPRVLLIASRFTTVVRHSIADAARGFAALGWETHVCTERADHERLTPEAVVHTVAGFRPDLILTANYHRYHFAGLPDGIPFVCWIQDDMAHLIEPGAGDRLGERDFVMGAWARRYVNEWGYPGERCWTVPRMVEVPAFRPAGRACDDGPPDDLVYVSSHSARPEAVLDQLAPVGAGTAPARAAARAGRALLDLYGRGGSVASPHDLRVVLLDAARDEGIETPDPAWLNRVTELLALHLNNPLYRQQGLAWAAETADRMGLSLAVYGPGWDRHPAFARFARGPIDPGDALARVTRSARFNLRLEPYPATCHQRLMDAIAAGGMVLSRRYAVHEEAEANLVEFYLTHLAGRVRCMDDARRALDDDRFGRLRTLIAAYRGVLPRVRDDDAAIAVLCDRWDQRTLDRYIHSPNPPGYFRTVFGDRAELESRLASFLADPEACRALCDSQREFVLERYGYKAGLTRLIGLLRSWRLAREAVACGSGP